MNIAIVTSFCLSVILLAVSYLASDFYVFDAKSRWNKAALSDRRSLAEFADSKILLVAKLTLAGGFVAVLTFFALLIWRGVQ